MSSEQELDFPRTTNHKIWETYLGRDLTQEEIMILGGVRSEKEFNNHLDELAINANKKKLFIPALSGLYGNCLFESMQILGFVDDHDEFRKNIACILKSFKNMKNFFQNQSETLGELFTFMNDIEFVMETKSQVLYKYTYEIMYRDLTNGFSWTRLPTQLIFMIMSKLFNARIHILSNTSEYVNTIYTGAPDANPIDIYLGHIGEVHYVPLAKMNEGETYPVPKYADARIVFFRWAKALALSRQTYANQIEQKQVEQKQVESTEKKVNF